MSVALFPLRRTLLAEREFAFWVYAACIRFRSGVKPALKRHAGPPKSHRFSICTAHALCSAFHDTGSNTAFVSQLAQVSRKWNGWFRSGEWPGKRL